MGRSLDLPGAPGQNTGHGHVFARPDGARARCGGPRLCQRCRVDAEYRDELAQRRADEVAELRARVAQFETTGQALTASEQYGDDLRTTRVSRAALHEFRAVLDGNADPADASGGEPG